MHTVSNLESAASIVLKSPELAKELVDAAFQDFAAARKTETNADGPGRTFYTKENARLLSPEIDLLIKFFGDQLRVCFQFDAENSESHVADMLNSTRRALFSLPTLSNIRIAVDEALNEHEDIKSNLAVLGFFQACANGGRWQDELKKARFGKILKSFEKTLFKLFIAKGERELRKSRLPRAGTVIIGFPEHKSLSRDDKDWIGNFASEKTKEVIGKIRETFGIDSIAANSVSAGGKLESDAKSV